MKHVLVLLSAAACVSARRGPEATAHHKRGPERMVIGYRSVSAEQAEIYNNARTLVYTKNVGVQQLGPGVYTTPDSGWWKQSGP
ncbi:hypothetical protein CDD83_10796 [Cordyceps sp. RAO-2017]|nr:hypothetical protein CDD83_10796 [Cordyceps sp. RAO-2017]